MRRRVFQTILTPYVEAVHQWSTGEGCYFPSGDYIYEGHISPSVYTLEQLLAYVENGKLVEISTLDPDLEVDEGL